MNQVSLADTVEIAATHQLSVRHVTRCRYDQPVACGKHLLRLRPKHDRIQTLRAHRLEVTPSGSRRDFEEAFGNMATRLEINEPHQELTITAESLVDVLAADPFAPLTPDYRLRLPVAWMPWERQVLEPYLEPPELPEEQLMALYRFGHELAEQNQRDVSESMFALNLLLFREFEYKPGSTTLETTAYDVLQSRAGVCQDFANLFICVARLMELPARYVCGYVLPGTGAGGDALAQATHAWVEIYMPQVGWLGFDPTNGVVPTTQHIRVAHGRHYRDATPITGWLEPGTGQELEVEVQVAEVGVDTAEADEETI